MAARLVTVVLAAAPVLLLSSDARAETVATVTSPDGVNLRSGPGTSFAVLAVLPFGAQTTVTGAAVENGWLPVIANGLAGYVFGEYLAPAPAAPPAGTPASPTPVAAPVPAATPIPPSGGPAVPQYAIIVPPDGLNLRQGPGTSYAVLIAVPGGARVQLVGRPTADGWYSVVYNDRLGWVDGKYLTIGTSMVNVATQPVAQPAGPPAPAPSRFIWPVASRRISTLFSAGHPGNDIDEYPVGGNPVVAVAAGTVTFAGGTVCCSYGLYVIVKHADGYTSLYAHLGSISVTEGQEVKQGTVLGKSGNTGNSTGAHLHLEIRKDGVAVDPLTLLPGPHTIE